MNLLDTHLVIDGHRIATGIHGPTAGPPVLLGHGTPSHSGIWRNVVGPLAEAGYRVHLYDLLGYGASERPLDADTSVAGQEALLLQLLQAWGIDRVHYVAHDLSTAIGQRLAVHNPAVLRSLMLIDGVGYDSWPSPTWRRIIDEHFDSYRRMDADEFRDMMTGQLLMTVANEWIMTGEVLDLYLRPLVGPLQQVSYFEHQMRHYDSRYTEEIADALPRIDLPVGLLWGAEDEWQPVHYAERLAADIPGAELEVVPRGGHFLMEDAPDLVADRILAFLR